MQTHEQLCYSRRAAYRCCCLGGSLNGIPKVSCAKDKGKASVMPTSGRNEAGAERKEGWASLQTNIAGELGTDGLHEIKCRAKWISPNETVKGDRAPAAQCQANPCLERVGRGGLDTQGIVQLLPSLPWLRSCISISKNNHPCCPTGLHSGWKSYEFGWPTYPRCCWCLWHSERVPILTWVYDKGQFQPS